MTVPPLNVISRATAEIVLSWKKIFFFNSASKMANWRHELAHLVMGTIFLVNLFVGLVENVFVDHEVQHTPTWQCRSHSPNKKPSRKISS